MSVSRAVGVWSGELEKFGLFAGDSFKNLIADSLELLELIPATQEIAKQLPSRSLTVRPSKVTVPSQ